MERTVGRGEGEAPAPARTKAELYEDRIKDFAEVLSAEVIDVKRLRKLAMGGIPETKPGDAFSLRARTWKVLLGHLSEDTTKWRKSQEKKRKQYADFCEEFLLDPAKIAAESDGGNPSDAAARNREGSLSTSHVDDDPLRYRTKRSIFTAVAKKFRKNYLVPSIYLFTAY